MVPPLFLGLAEAPLQSGATFAMVVYWLLNYLHQIILFQWGITILANVAVVQLIRLQYDVLANQSSFHKINKYAHFHTHKKRNYSYKIVGKVSFTRIFLLATVPAVSCLEIITRNSCPALHKNIFIFEAKTLTEQFGLILFAKFTISHFF